MKKKIKELTGKAIKSTKSIKGGFKPPRIVTQKVKDHIVVQDSL